MIERRIQIREAKLEDAIYISLLGRITFKESFEKYFRYRNDLLTYLDETFAVEKIRNSIQKINNIYWIAFADDLPIGFAKLKLNSESKSSMPGMSCQLQKIYVLRDFSSMKIGTRLLTEILQKVKNEYTHIWLSVLKHNTRAIQFYTHNLFNRVGEHQFQIGSENFEFFVMRKILTQ